MPQQNYLDELTPAFTPLLAIKEASRCLLCHDAPCSQACPAQTDPGKFIRSIYFRNFKGAAETIRENNALGAVCARVCPTEKLCQSGCTRAGVDAPIDIGRLQRFVTDFEQQTGMEIYQPGTKTLGKVAIIGAGPAGLQASVTLTNQGYDVTIYEKEAQPGGWLRNGIPQFRLPQSVLDAEIARIEKMGVTIKCNNEVGNTLTLEQLKAELSENTALVSVMAANNEIGTIQPIKQIAELAHSVGAKFHTDAVQAVGHMHIDVQEMGIDMLSLSGHKFRGPRGTGVLYVKKGITLEPLVYGGGQERGLVSGTENTAGCIGLAAAMKEAVEGLDEKMGYVKKLTDKLVKGIMENIPYSHYTGDPVNRLPGTASFVFEAIEGEGLILRLDNAGVCGSTGSACSTGSLDPSHVLMAIGLPHEIAHGSLRLTLGEQNTEEDVDYIIETVTDVVKTLRSMSPVWENGKPNLTAAADLTAHH